MCAIDNKSLVKWYTTSFENNEAIIGRFNTATLSMTLNVMLKIIIDFDLIWIISDLVSSFEYAMQNAHTKNI